ncbi:MAG: hypothetical protein R3C10_01215 [Pirellulales bacterium]
MTRTQRCGGPWGWRWDASRRCCRDIADRRQAAQFLLVAYRQSDPADRYLHDGLLRGIERIGDMGVGLFVELARSNDPADRELAVSAIEALRTESA